MPANEKRRYVMTSDLRQYIAEYTVANFWRYPIRRRVTYASALELSIFFRQKLTTVLLKSVEGREWSTTTKEYCQTRRWSNPRPTDPQSDAHPTEAGSMESYANGTKKGKRKVQGVPQSQTAALPRPQEEEETDKSKQAQTEQTYEKHLD